MKILVLGGSGMLGHKLIRVLKANHNVWTTIRADFESFQGYNILDRQKTFSGVSIEDMATIENLLDKIEPEVVINAIGIIKQIPNAADIIQTLKVNSIFPNQLAQLSKQLKFKLILVSTDCVFSGNKGNYTEEDIPDAIDLYGKSKNLGEVITDNCLTIRTSIIGRELETAHSLLEWFLNTNEKSVKGYKNAVFSGFPTVVLAKIIAEIIANHPHLNGLYHVSSEPINKYDLLNLIKEFYRLDTKIEPFEDYKIDRSLDSTKFRNATGFQPERWREMIRIMRADDEASGIYHNKKQEDSY